MSDDKITPFPGSTKTSVVQSLRQFFGATDDARVREIKAWTRWFYFALALFLATATGGAAYYVGRVDMEMTLRDEFMLQQQRDLGAYNARLINLRNQWAAQVKTIQEAAQQRVATVEQKLKQQERESNARIRKLRSENEKFKTYYDAQVPADVPGIIWGDGLRLGAANAAGDS
ncbi:MAG: hypothetical protein SV201_05735 [Pseudomonadota bacterium]|nr:hypothetical protein [Pseudomonadota bacterium]